MKRKSYLLIALVLAAVVSSGSYAYTFSQATVTLNVTAAGGDIATVEEAADQPGWVSILTASETYTEISRPEAAGDKTDILFQLPFFGEHWDKVDEETPDGFATYIANNGAEWQEDLYHITNSTVGSGAISYVKVYMVSRALAEPTQPSAYVLVKTNGAERNGTEETLTADYAVYSYQWDTNPVTGAPWTWEEIGNLQIGVGLTSSTEGVPKVFRYSLCTQVYAEIGYTGIKRYGEVPAGELFEITPHADYPGDLGVTVYLTNTDELTKAFQYLNMKLYLEGSIEAGQTPNYQLLTLDNGVATFILEGGASDNFTMSIAGGGYGVNSNDPLAWEAGWSVTPELYCEVTQKGRE